MSILRAFVHALALWALLRFGLGQVESTATSLWLAVLAGALAGGAAAGGLAGGAILCISIAADPGARAALAAVTGEGGPAELLPYGLAILVGLVASVVAGALGREDSSGSSKQPESAASVARAQEAFVAEGQVDEAVARALALGRPRMAHDLFVGAKRKDDAHSVLRHVGLVSRTRSAPPAKPVAGAEEAPASELRDSPPLELEVGVIDLGAMDFEPDALDVDEPGLGQRNLAPEQFRDADEPLFEFEEPSGAVGDGSEEEER